MDRIRDLASGRHCAVRKIPLAVTQMTDRKKPDVAFWATVGLVVVLVGYPLSFGPACWISSYYGQYRGFVEAIYQPILQTQFGRPYAISRPVGMYAGLFARKGSIFTKFSDGRVRWSNWDP
jgi:hypothetical protein